MEFNFETPLILRLRKIAHSKTVLWCGILFAIMPILSGYGLVSYLLSNPTFEYTILIVSRFIAFLLPCISFFTVYISARNKDSVLPTGGFTAAGILCILAGVFWGISLLRYSRFFGLGEMFYFTLFGNGGNPGRILEHEMAQIRIVSLIAIVVFEVFFVTLAATFFSASSVARNNKPKKFFAILLAIVSFMILAFYILYFVKNVINGRISDIIQYFVFTPKFAINCILSDLLVFFLPIAAMILCGCVGIGFCKASRRIK